MDDRFLLNPKVMRAGLHGRALYIAGLCYASGELTDGFLPQHTVRKLCLLADVSDTGRAVERLIESGLWEVCEGGYQIHDYLKYQPSREKTLTERTMNRARKDLYADPDLTRRIKQRDRDHCRYCGIPVRWTDRKGPAGGTFDHVDPTAGNNEANLVVACRACNGIKGRRSPAQAGMPLLPVPPDLDPIQIRTSSNLDKDLPTYTTQDTTSMLEERGVWGENHPPQTAAAEPTLFPTGPPPGSPSDAEQACLTVLRGVTGYPLELKTDLALLRDLAESYSVDVLDALKDWAAAKTTEPLKPKDRPRAQIRTWVRKRAEWQKADQARLPRGPTLNGVYPAPILGTADELFAEWDRERQEDQRNNSA